jgi:hypothetical protein
VSRKVTVPAVSEVAPAFTVAVILNTEPLAAVEGVIARVVVVVVCALATAQDITMNSVAHRAVRGFVRRVAFIRAVAFLERPNIPPALPEICGSPIASGHSAVRKRDCERTHLTAATKDQRDFNVVLAEHAAGQKRSRDRALRETFINTGISKPFGWYSDLGILLPGQALFVVHDREALLCEGF